jgi:hypothetical protein
MKKAIILEHGGGELANQLWNYASIYAYGLEAGARVRNPSFFEYHSFFRFLPKESLSTKIFSAFFQTPRRRSHIINKTGRLKHTFFAKLISTANRSCVYSSRKDVSEPTYLPPTHPLPSNLETCDTIYFTGWLFRNPKGIEKWRSELIKAFAPKEEVLKRAGAIIVPLRQKYEKVISIHIRQGDYKDFKGGKYVISQERVREIVTEYIKENNLDIAKTTFVLASDGPVDENLYKDLTVHVTKENAITDLFLLSMTDAVIGSDSSFGAFAAWYGNIPHIIMQKGTVDWQYYTDKKRYFENKYSTLVHY